MARFGETSDRRDDVASRREPSIPRDHRHHRALSRRLTASSVAAINDAHPIRQGGSSNEVGIVQVLVSV